MRRASLLLFLTSLVSIRPALADIKPIVEIEEEVYRYQDPANGAGPFWCAGSSCIVRQGDRVFVSGMEKLADAKPLNNTRWILLERTAEKWTICQKDPAGRTREPSPLGPRWQPFSLGQSHARGC